jgi:hypothetical protein
MDYEIILMNLSSVVPEQSLRQIQEITNHSIM